MRKPITILHLFILPSIFSCNQGAKLFVDHVLEIGKQLETEFDSISEESEFKFKLPNSNSKFSLKDQGKLDQIKKRILEHPSPIDTLTTKIKELQNSNSSYLNILAAIGAIAGSRSNFDVELPTYCKEHLGNFASAMLEKKLQKDELTKVIRPLISSYQFSRDMNLKLLLDPKQLKSSCHEAQKAVEEKKLRVSPYPLTNVTIQYEKMLQYILEDFITN